MAQQDRASAPGPRGCLVRREVVLPRLPIIDGGAAFAQAKGPQHHGPAPAHAASEDRTVTRLGPDARWRAITGTLLIGFGGALTLVTLLAALGFVPLFQPTVPPPVALQTPAAAPLLVAPRSPSATALPPLAAAPLVPEPAMLPMPAPTPSPSPTWPPTTAPVRPSSTIARRLPTRLSLPPPSVTPVPTATATPLPTPVPPPPPPGLPVRLRIPSIGVDTPVVELDMVEDPAEGWRWET